MWASPHLISPPANSAPPNSAVPMPTAESPMSCRPCARANCSTPRRCRSSKLLPLSRSLRRGCRARRRGRPAYGLHRVCALCPLERDPLDDWIFATDYAIPLVENHFGVFSLEGFGLAATMPPPAPPEPSSITSARPSADRSGMSTASLLRAPELPHSRCRYRPQPGVD